MAALFRGKWLQAWRWRPPYAAEQNLDDVVRLCRDYGLAGVLFKACDGIGWMGHLDPYAPRIASIGDVQALQTFFETAGLGFGCWVNPRCDEDAYLMAQAVRYAEIGRITGLLAWDTEPYEGFWGANQRPGAAFGMLERFRQVAPGCVNIWQPDSRPARLAELRPEEWAPHMNVWAGQDYWTDFQSAPPERIAASYQSCRALGVGEFASTLPGNAPAADLSAAMELLASDRAEACIIWRLGTTGPEQLAAIRDGQLYLPPRPDPCERLRSGLAAELVRPGRPRRRVLRALLEER